MSENDFTSKESREALKRSMEKLTPTPEQARRNFERLRRSVEGLEPGSPAPAAPPGWIVPPMRLSLPTFAFDPIANARAVASSLSGRSSPDCPWDDWADDEKGPEAAPDATEPACEDFDAARAAAVVVTGEEPPEPPRVPSFARLLDGEGFARWVKRTELGDDRRLISHCIAVRRSFARSLVTARRVEEMYWPFPSFVPKARPFDWAVDL